MYENVIVPFDGSLPARAALAPAADLAWRCGARIVIVNNTEASDQASRQALKSRAMSMSGADVDFWVDTDHTIGEGVVEASRHRPNSIVCIAIREKKSGLLRKPLLTDAPAEVLVEARVPVLVVGPETDVSRGLPLAEVIVPLDGSATSEHVLQLAVQWANALRLRLLLVGVVKKGRSSHEGEIEYLEEKLDQVRAEVPESGFELVEAADPTSGIVGFLAGHDSAVVVMSTHGRSGVDRHPLGTVAQGVMLSSPRAIVFHRDES